MISSSDIRLKLNVSLSLEAQPKSVAINTPIKNLPAHFFLEKNGEMNILNNVLRSMTLLSPWCSRIGAGDEIRTRDN